MISIMAAGRIFGYSALFTLSLLLRVAYFEQYTTKPSANYLSSPMKAFCCVYDGNPDVFPLEKFDHAVCDVRHLELHYRRPSCSQSYRGKFGKSTLNYYSNSDASFHLNYFKVCGDVRGGSRISKGGVDGRPYLLRGARENALTKKIGNNFSCTCLRRVF